MRICTYTSTDAPASHAAVARILVDGGFLPVIIPAADADAAKAKAQTFWDAERERLQKGGKPRGRVDPAVDPKGVEPDMEWSTELEIASAAGALEPPEQIDLEDAIAATPVDPAMDVLG